MDDVNQTPESPQIGEAIEVNSAPATPVTPPAPAAEPTPATPATPELGGVFKAGKSKKPSKLLLWLLIVLGIILIGGGGYFTYGKYGDQILIKLGIKEATPATDDTTDTATDTGTTVTDETADWKTYKNATAGFSIEYPKTWIYDSPVANSVVFRDAEGDQWLMDIRFSGTDQTLSEAASADKTETELSGVAVAQSTIKIGSLDAIKFGLSSANEGLYGDTKYLVVGNSKLYKIMLGTGSDSTLIKMVNAFQLIK